MFEPVHRVMRGIWRKQTYAGKDEADDAEACRAVAKCAHSGDQGGRSEHDADLIRGRSDLVAVITRHGDVAVALVLFGLSFEVLAPVLLLGVGLITLDRRIPALDLLAH